MMSAKLNKKEDNMDFNTFCIEYLDRLYAPSIDLENQSTGYKMLRKMVLENTPPASIDEIKRWETHPTDDEILSKPDIKYLRFLHPLLREVVINQWSYISKLEVI